MKPQHPEYEAAVKAKRQFPTLDRLVTDAKLHKHLWRDSDPQEPLALTLGNALVRGVCVVGWLELQLATLVPLVHAGATSALASRLLNGRDGFVHTRSELGLAMTLARDGWQVELDVPLPAPDGRGARAKDVDLRVTRDGRTRYVDVLNLQHQNPSSSPNGFGIHMATSDRIRLLAGKVREKAPKKFDDAWSTAWDGSAWIAVDFAKHGPAYLSGFLDDGCGRSGWRDGVAASVLASSSRLAGVLIYSFGANDQVYSDPIQSTAWDARP